mmetsp:Transcript_116599/g.293280  ORF Transcript_116599/g.293280 Transcript_116599/m.293280 type:complete len:203 (-) Transcript_116599:284-892(-)
MNSLYAGTLRKASYLCGRWLRVRSCSSCSSHAFFSSSENKYSLGGLYDSACPGNTSFGAGRGAGPFRRLGVSSAHKSHTSGSGGGGGRIFPSRNNATSFFTRIRSHLDGKNRRFGGCALFTGWMAASGLSNSTIEVVSVVALGYMPCLIRLMTSMSVSVNTISRWFLWSLIVRHASGLSLLSRSASISPPESVRIILSPAMS